MMRKGGGSLLSPPGNAPIQWDDALLAEVKRCALAECSVAETARRVGVADYAVARGALICLAKVLRARRPAEAAE